MCGGVTGCGGVGNSPSSFQGKSSAIRLSSPPIINMRCKLGIALLSGVPDYFGRNKISSGGDLSHYSSASLY